MSDFQNLIAGQVEMETLKLELLSVTPPALRDEAMAEVWRLQTESSVQEVGFVRSVSHIEALRTVSDRMKRTGSPYA